jgi:hypothetical protein
MVTTVFKSRKVALLAVAVVVMGTGDESWFSAAFPCGVNAVHCRQPRGSHFELSGAPALSS